MKHKPISYVAVVIQVRIIGMLLWRGNGSQSVNLIMIIKRLCKH